jgi:hypothetical protein
MTKLTIAVVSLICVALLATTARAFDSNACSCGSRGVLNVALSDANQLCYCDTCTDTSFVGPNCTEAGSAYVIVHVVTLNDTAVTFFSSQAIIDQILANAALNGTAQCTQANGAAQPCIAFKARLLRDAAAPKYDEIHLQLNVQSDKALQLINFINARADPAQVQQRAWFQGPLPKELLAPWADSQTIATVTYNGDTAPIDVRAVIWVILTVVFVFALIIGENCVARCCCPHEDPELRLMEDSVNEVNEEGEHFAVGAAEVGSPKKGDEDAHPGLPDDPQPDAASPYGSPHHGEEKTDLAVEDYSTTYEATAVE